MAVDVALVPQRVTEGIVVTARRVEEEVQEVPIPVSVLGGDIVADAGAFNVNRLKEQIPTVQFYSTNPRNSSVQIRGLGSPFGLTNDGLEPGVGLYIDGAFYARPAAATADFLDVERIEVLRGPQGTLFGKNTTAGAINITTRKPSFTPDNEFELNYGSYGFVQARASVTGPLTDKIAGRISFSGTQRDGLLENTRTQDDVNDLNNLGVRGQLLGDADRQECLDADRRLHPSASGGLHASGRRRRADASVPRTGSTSRSQPTSSYTAPSFNAFDRVTDVDTPMRSYQDLGGAALTYDRKLSSGLLTSVSSWRYWDWNPSNDRDFIGLPITTVSAAPSKQRQWTQEVRYAGNLSSNVNLVAGVFGFYQTIDSDPTFKQEHGSAAARYLLAPTQAALTPGLLDGYGFNQYLAFDNLSAAVFGQVEWRVTDRLRILPGLRLNYDDKKVDFDQQIYGGLQTTDPALIALQRSVLAPQKYATDVDDTNLSGQFTVAYKLAEAVNTYGTYAKTFKSVGLNLNGVPTDALGNPVLSAATVLPEDVDHVEFGVKTTPFAGVTANLSVYNSNIKDFQAQVVNAGVGVLRGYLANADKVRVRGVEFDATARVGSSLSFYGAGAYTDGIYVSFPDAPPPLEDTGGPQVKDISGSVLPGISKWAFSLGGEYAQDGDALRRGRPCVRWIRHELPLGLLVERYGVEISFR